MTRAWHKLGMLIQNTILQFKIFFTTSAPSLLNDFQIEENFSDSAGASWRLSVG
jgi:hypothetical protein